MFVSFTDVEKALDVVALSGLKRISGNAGSTCNSISMFVVTPEGPYDPVYFVHDLEGDEMTAAVAGLSAIAPKAVYRSAGCITMTADGYRVTLQSLLFKESDHVMHKRLKDIVRGANYQRGARAIAEKSP